MKYAKIIVVALVAFLCVSPSEAQVSVRRTSRSSSEQPMKPNKDNKKSEPKNNKSSERKSSARMSDNPSSSKTSTSTVKSASTPSVAKKTVPNTKKQQPQNMVAEGKTVRQQAFDTYQQESVQNVPWQHVVYRELDLTKEENASLYYPVEPMDGLTNLFRVIIEAFAKGELPAYEYLDGRELFTDDYRCKPQDILDKFKIGYEQKTQRGGTELFEIDESTVPSHQVLSYFVKERWEFDQQHSKYQSRILCICPVLHRSDEMSDDAKYPIFWVRYEDLRPFLRQHLVVSSGMNSAARYTMEEYFSLGQYKGDIYKDSNLRGLSLKQQVGDNPDTLFMVQERLDKELRAFGDSIWDKEVTPDATNQKKVAKHQKVEAQSTLSEQEPTGATKKNRRTKENVDLDIVAAEKEAKATAHKSVRR